MRDPMSHAVANLNRKITDKIQKETIYQGQGTDCLQSRINDLVLEFFKSHGMPFNPAVNTENPDEIARGILEICQMAKDRAFQVESQRLIEGIGEQIMKEHFKA